ncbi:MAG: aldo/keto reductase [Fimbriimonadaceae bacterium]|nr:aldo/keto reductase [Fimbriimonadaceae bacterium]
MQYRRFGRTELRMPVLSCGGMRYQQAWQDVPVAQIEAAGQRNLEDTIHAALAHGINHIETARGYGSSEVQLGQVLPNLPRQELIVQTKVGPQESADAFRRTFDTSLERLRLDYVDLLAVHGINNRELLNATLAPDGMLAAARAIQAEGRARHIGFSTHAPLDVILDAIGSDGFDYVNLHYYWADQIKAPAVAAAAAHDMGVFIISPSEKGGRLFDPPAKLSALCAPLSPLAFNDLWTLANPAVHTLSVGAARPSDFEAHVAAVAQLEQAAALTSPIAARLQDEAVAVWGEEWINGWAVGLPATDAVPGTVNLYHVLRLYTLARAFDLVEYARWRYNLFGNGGHWFYGNKVDQLDFTALPAVLRDSPVAARIPALLHEAHELLAGEAKKRLSEGG